MMPCPNDEDLARLFDGALALEETEKLRVHVARCLRCRDHEDALRMLIEDVKAAVPAELDVGAHVRAVMDRVSRPVPVPGATGRARRAWAYAGASAVLACVLVSSGSLRRHSALTTETWQARGGGARATIGRDVGVQPYGAEGELRPLTSGATIDRHTPLTAGFRNLGPAPAFLLLFAVDKRQAVHWISPPYTRPEDDPASTMLPSTFEEQMLGTTVALEDMPPGPLRIVSVITSARAHVSDVESLEGPDLSAGRLIARLPSAEVRETVVDVRDADGATR